MSKIFFTADQHHLHLNKRNSGIMEYEPKRGLLWKDINEHTEALIKNHNEIVAPNDIVYNLGDFCFGNAEKVKSILSQLNGRQIIITGNHDRNINSLKKCGFAEVYKDTYIFNYGIHKIYLTHWPENAPAIADKNEPIIRVLCGHVHSLWKTQRSDNFIYINVGVDVWEYKPVSLNELWKLFYLE